MKTFNKLAVLLMAVCTLCSCTKEEAELTGTIYGKITNLSGEILPSVTMTLSPGGASRTTGSDGTFEMTDLEPGQYTLQAQKSGYKTNTKTVRIVAGQTASGDMVLTPENREADIVIEPSYLNFGNTQTEMAVNIKNNGTASSAWSVDLGNNNWIEVRPAQGNIAAGKQQIVTFSVNREKITEQKNVIVSISANGNTYPVTVNCAPAGAKVAEMSITPKMLDFGSKTEKLSLEIKNTGEAELKWMAKGLTVAAFKLSAESGTVAPGGTSLLYVEVDRTQVTADIQTSFIITDGSKDEAITLKCAPAEASKAVMVITPKELDFGTDTDKLGIEIKNTGDAELKWTAKDLTNPAFKLSAESGNVAPGGSSLLYVEVDRTQVTADIRTSFIITDGTKDEAITLKCAAASSKKGVLSVSPKVLDFGTDTDKLSLEIKNIGDAELFWVALALDEPALSLSEEYSYVKPGEVHKVDVNVDRSLVTADIQTSFEIYDGVTIETINVKIAKGQSGGNGDNPGGNANATVVPEGMYVYYKFDGDFNDATENAVNGFGQNNPTFIEGITTDSKAVKFNRTDNSFFNVPNSIMDTKEMSFSFWGKDFSDGNIFYTVNSDNKKIHTFVMTNGSLKYVAFEDCHSSTRYNKCASFTHPTLTDGKWHHIAVTTDYGKSARGVVTAKLYVDGNLVDVTTHSSYYGDARGTYGDSMKFVIGGSGSFSSSVSFAATNMTVDNFRVYDTRSLSSQEVKAIYDAKQ